MSECVELGRCHGEGRSKLVVCQTRRVLGGPDV